MGLFSGKSEQGVGQVGIIAVIIGILVVGGVGWWVWDKNKKDTPQQQAIANAKCDFEDKDICKFFAAWKATENYSVEITGESEGQSSKMTLRVEGKDKTHSIFSGALNYETITVGNTRYTKAGDTWYKETMDAEELQDFQAETEIEFDEPTNDGKIAYAKLGTEDCDKRKCFKYHVVDANTPDNTLYIWFDTKDYLLRRVESTNKGENPTVVIFNYNKVTISEPSPVKDLGENQYIVPGQSEPTTLPNAGDGGELTEEQLQELLRQYQQ